MKLVSNMCAFAYRVLAGYRLCRRALELDAWIIWGLMPRGSACLGRPGVEAPGSGWPGATWGGLGRPPEGRWGSGGRGAYGGLWRPVTAECGVGRPPGSRWGSGGRAACGGL